MIVSTEEHEGRTYGKVELGMEDGYHVGTVVIVFVQDDGAPVVEITTPDDTETHEVLRVWVNDDRVS